MGREGVGREDGGISAGSTKPFPPGCSLQHPGGQRSSILECWRPGLGLGWAFSVL